MWEYVEAVEAGDVVVGKYIKLAVQRFRAMMKRAEEDPDCPYYFDQKKAKQFVSFCELCKQYKDKWAGQPLKLQPWQVWIFGQIYGFRAKNGTRYFRKAVIFVGRKNGKSSMMSPVAVWDAATVPGGEVYCLATKRDQAKIVYDAVVHTINQDPDLKSMFQQYRSANRMVNKANSSIISPLSSDYSTMDGLNPSTGIADEIAAWKEYDLINVIESGMGARTDPFIFEITSGSDNVNSVGAQEMEQGKKCLEGLIDDPTTLYILYTIDDKDSWMDPSCFAKANPGLGVTVSMDNMMSAMRDAMNNPQKEGEFRTKRLCSFISPMTAWISAHSWRKCMENGYTWGKELPPISECAVVAGVDLSQRLDFTAYSIYFLHVETKRFWTKHHFYIPTSMIEEKCKHDSKLVRKWIEEGYITATGDQSKERISYENLFQDLERDIEEYKIKEVLYDPWNAGELINRMGPLVDLVEIRQSLKDISPLAKDWEAEILNGNIADNNPVMAWMVSNCDIYTDPNGNIRPVKSKGQRDTSIHIDGCVTSLMACGRLCQLLGAGELDMRSAEEIEADVEAALALL